MKAQNRGLVLWLMGLSGAGKTTLGRRLYRSFQEAGPPCYVLDGDEARRFFDQDLKFSREDRMANIKRLIWGAYLLSENGIHTIVCNISPFEELRQFARARIQDYHQVYLKKGIQACVRDDPKGIYREHLGRSQLVGVDLLFEEPERNDLTITTGQISIAEAAEQIRAYLRERRPDLRL